MGVVAVLCDADGTLFPSEEPAFYASAEVTNAMLAEFGVGEQLNPEALRRSSTGKNFRTTAAHLLGSHGVQLAPEHLERWVHAETDVVTRHLSRVLQPDPEVTGPLNRLAERFRLAAVSSSATRRLAACFRATELASLIPVELCFSAEDSLPQPCSKPDPAVYRYACERLGLRPEQCRAVEDSVPGVQSAVGAGIPTIGLLQFVAPAERPERRRDLLGVGAATVLESWAEVVRLLLEVPAT
jgi:beta-phosphoglucomutase-like phosphatase (HAD superfamily)